jgi:hypothetical protein
VIGKSTHYKHVYAPIYPFGCTFASLVEALPCCNPVFHEKEEKRLLKGVEMKDWRDEDVCALVGDEVGD